MNRVEKIMMAMNDIHMNNDDDVLGCFIRETNSDEGVGEGICYMFEKYPEHAELLIEMAEHIYGGNMEELIEDVNNNKESYHYEFYGE